MDDVLKDEPEPQEKPETPETPETPEPEVKAERPESLRSKHRAREQEARERRPDGTFLPKEEPREEKVEAKPEAKVEPKPEVRPPQQELTEKERGFLRAAEEERRKRQELERRLEALEKRPVDQKPEEKKTFWDDPEGHFKSVEQRLAQREVALKLNVSEQIARSKYQDFDANVEVFGEILRTPAGPGIHAQWLASQDPAEFAYKMGKQTRELREAGNIEALRAKIEKETREKLEAEYKAKQEELEKERKALPPSLSSVRGGGAKPQPAWNGPPSLEDILK